MQIKNHSSSDKYFVVSQATEAATARAKQLVGSWAKIQSNGLLIVHNNFRREFEMMVERDSRDTTIAPEVSSIDEMERWLFDNLNSSKLADRLAQLHPQVFNRLYAGKTAAEIEEEN